MNAQHDDPRLENHGSHLLTVKSDGYLIPDVEMAKSRSEGGALGISWGGSILANREDFYFNVNTAYNIWSYGNMSQELQDRRETAENLARAPATPPIPKWLADNPPMWVEFIPDDEILTFGPLGSWDDESVLQSNDWYCYSRDGELVGQTKPGQQWWFEMFFPDFRKTWIELGDMPEVQFRDLQGIITFCKYDPYEELAVYDYKGNPDPDQFQWDSQPMLFMVIEGRDIPAMYARQQAAATSAAPADEDGSG